jgi:hypothetical protein
MITYPFSLIVSLLALAVVPLAIGADGVVSAAGIDPEMAETFLGYVKDNEQVVLVRVFDEHSQLTAGEFSIRIDWQGKVIESIKGDWKVGETIRYFMLLEEFPKGLLNENNRQQITPMQSDIGRLKYLFVHTHDHKTPVGLQAGDGWDFKPGLEALLKKAQH